MHLNVMHKLLKNKNNWVSLKYIARLWRAVYGQILVDFPYKFTPWRWRQTRALPLSAFVSSFYGKGQNEPY